MFKNPTGGIGYHLGALRSSRHRWAAFREALEKLLVEWTTRILESDGNRGSAKSHLILVGPSGGYCLSGAWLKQFGEISVLEIDPFARLLFRFRFGRLNVRFIKRDILMTSDLRDWNEFLEAHDGFILFCNILGQLPLTVPRSVASEGRESWGRARIAEILSVIPPRYSWASFHDRISFRAISRHGSAIFSKSTHLTTAEICDIASRRWKIHDVCDHGTDQIGECAGVPIANTENALSAAELNPSLNRNDAHLPHYLVWPLGPSQAHIIEWVTRL